MNDVWAGRVLRDQGVETDRFEDLPADLNVMVEQIELKHRDRTENFRPYLHVSGELRSIIPTEAGVLPYGITEIAFSIGHGERVDAYYEFSDDQLVALAGKGYFSSGFAVPDTLTGIEWQLPAQTNVVVLAVPGAEGITPVVFTKVRDIASAEISRASTGYELLDYFPDPTPQSEISEVETERATRTRSDEINSLFEDSEVAVELQEEAPQTTETAELSGVADVHRLLEVFDAENAAEAEKLQVVAPIEVTAEEHLYEDRIASALQAYEYREQPVVQATTSEATTETDVVPPVAVLPAEPTVEERKQQIARRAADLDLGDDETEVGWSL